MGNDKVERLRVLTRKAIVEVAVCSARFRRAMQRATVAGYRFTFYFTVAQLGGKGNDHVQDV